MMSRASRDLTARACVRACVDAPRITQAPRDQKVVDGGIATFTCLATGNPPPDVYFRRPAGTTAGGPGRRLTATRHRGGGGGGGEGRYSVLAVAHGAVLRVTPVSARRDDGAVECIAENGLGDPAVASATLHVYPDGHGT